MVKLAVSRIHGLGLPVRVDCQGSTNPINNTTQATARALTEVCSRYLTQEGKGLQESLEKTSSEFHRGFLRGFFDADGSVQGTLKKGVSVRLCQSDSRRLGVVQRMLSRLGIASTVYLNRKEEGWKRLPDGKGGHRKYWMKAMHELVVARDLRCSPLSPTV
jgi:ribonucleoside-diphosphate reductase alpha chain